jgi:branched-chain amino acid transport system permease protein
MIVGIMKVVNFAQGDCLTVGMYLTFLLQVLTGWDPLLLLLPVSIFMFAFGLVLFEIVIRPIANRENTVFTVVTMGLAYVISTGLLLIFGGMPRSVSSVISASTLTIGTFSIAMPRVVAFLVMLICIVLLHFFLKKTDMGRAMRATAENREIAEILGINTAVIMRLSFALGIMFAGVAGLLLTPTYYLYPSTGGTFMIVTMVCVVIGGLGNIAGAVLGGILIGIMESFIATFISVDLSQGGAFILLLLVLIFMPNGLFGKGERIA